MPLWMPAFAGKTVRWGVQDGGGAGMTVVQRSPFVGMTEAVDSGGPAD